MCSVVPGKEGHHCPLPPPSVPFAAGMAQHPFRSASLPLAEDEAVRRSRLISIEFVTVCAIVEREEEEEGRRETAGERPRSIRDLPG